MTTKTFGLLPVITLNPLILEWVPLFPFNRQAQT